MKEKSKKRKWKFLLGSLLLIEVLGTGIVVWKTGVEKEKNSWKTPEALLVEYMNHISKQEYEAMYEMLNATASGNVSQEDFIKRNAAIYEGIEMENMIIQVTGYQEETLSVTYNTSFDTVAGNISFENQAFFIKGEGRRLYRKQRNWEKWNGSFI